MDTPASDPRPSSQDKPCRVLYIEDEATLRTTTKAYIKNAGFEIDTAASAAEGLELLKERGYDAIISDYEMPEMNGLELLTTLRNAGNDIPFIIFTGRGREEVAIAALNAGADFYLQKGGKPEAQFAELVNAVSQAIQRRRAERELHHSEAEKEHILDALSEMMIFILPDYTVAWTNHTFRKILGKSQEEIVGRPCYEVIRGGKKPCDICLVPQVLETGKPATKEATFPDGRIFEVTTHPAKDESGTITGFIERARDITEFRTAQRDLQNHKHELELTVNAITGGIWKRNFITDELWFSPRYYTMLGYEPDAFPADHEHWVDLLHPDDRESALRVSEEYLQHKPDRYESEFRLRTIDGTYRWIHAVGRVVEWAADGTAIRMIGNHEDVTTLRENEMKYRALFNKARDMIYLHEVTDDGFPGRILEANEQACKTMGYTPDEFRTMVVSDINDPDYEENLSTIIKEILPTGESVFEWRHITKDGRKIPVEISVRGFQLQGRIVALSVARDVSEQQRTREALLLASKKVSLLNSITRHDIINLINAQAIYLDLLRNTVDPKKRAEYLDILGTTTSRMEHDVLFTRDYHKLGAGTPVWQSPEENIRANWSSRHDAGSVRLEVTTGDDLQIFADRMLPKVFVNLMDNAFRHGGGITCLTFSAEERGSELAFICEDDGVGISPEKKDTLFSPVFNKNHGYGLYLISEILGITGMTVTEEGTPGKGARFVIHVPGDVWRDKPGKRDETTVSNQ